MHPLTPAQDAAPVSSAAPISLTDEERFDLKCIRVRAEQILALGGCGDAHCAPAKCLFARHARVTLKAIAALTNAHSLDARTNRG
jgi:hypothetical protein